jgi:hypothetical protein
MGLFDVIASILSGGISDYVQGKPIFSGTAVGDWAENDGLQDVWGEINPMGKNVLGSPSAGHIFSPQNSSIGSWMPIATSAVIGGIASAGNPLLGALAGGLLQTPKATQTGNYIPVAVGAASGYAAGGGFSGGSMPAADIAGGGVESGYGFGGQIGDSSSGMMNGTWDAGAGAYNNYAPMDYLSTADQSLSLEPYSDYTGAGGQFQVNQGLAPEGYFPQTPYTGGQYFQVDQTLNPSSPQYNPTKWYEDALQNPKVKDLAKKLGQKGFQMLMQGMMGKPKPYPNPMQAPQIGTNYTGIPVSQAGLMTPANQTAMPAISTPGVDLSLPSKPLDFGYSTDFSMKKTKAEEKKIKDEEEKLAAQLKPGYLTDYSLWKNYA